MSTGLHNVSGRAAILVCIAGVHVFVLIMIFRTHSRLSDADEFRSILFFIEPNEPSKQPTSTSVRAGVKSRKPKATLRTPSAAPPGTKIEPETGDDLTDWREQATHAVGEVVDRLAKSRRRPAMSGLSKLPDSTVEVVPDNLFHGPMHRRGDSVRTEDGEVITWLDDKCYATNRDFGPPRESANNMVIVCKGNVGKRPIDGELLRHLKPKYLRGAEIDSASSADKESMNSK